MNCISVSTVWVALSGGPKLISGNRYDDIAKFSRIGGLSPDKETQFAPKNVSRLINIENVSNLGIQIGSKQ